MKIVDKMKDEDLGVALIYNFTKGYQKAVPMEMYDIVLPLLYNDTFRNEILNHHSFHDCLLACASKDENFKENVLSALEDYKTMTSKALGIAMIQHILKFQIVDQTMCGLPL